MWNRKLDYKKAATTAIPIYRMHFFTWHVKQFIYAYVCVTKQPSAWVPFALYISRDVYVCVSSSLEMIMHSTNSELRVMFPSRRWCGFLSFPSFIHTYTHRRRRVFLLFIYVPQSFSHRNPFSLRLEILAAGALFIYNVAPYISKRKRESAEFSLRWIYMLFALSDIYGYTTFFSCFMCVYERG